MNMFGLNLAFSVPCAMSQKKKGPAADFFESPKKTGWLTKMGGSGLKTNWRRRYVVLDHHYLFYYKSEKDRSPCGNICLPDYDIVARADAKECKKPNSFMITSSNNIAPTSSSELKRVYYLYADSEEECMAWSVAIEEEMIAVIDPNQKHYFTLHDMGLHSSTKNGYQDNGGTFDDLTTVVEDGYKLEHVTAQRPKKPHTRAPSRGQKDFDTIDEDDISTFACSPASAVQGPSEKKVFKRRVSPITKPLKPQVPPSETIAKLQEPPQTKPRPAAKPKYLMKHSKSSDSAVSPEKQQQQKSADPQIIIESIPIPTPRRTAPTIPDSPIYFSQLLIEPPTPPTPPQHPSRSLSLKYDITPPQQQQQQHKMTPQQHVITPQQQQQQQHDMTPQQYDITPQQQQQHVITSQQYGISPPLRIRKSLSHSSSSSSISKHSSLGSIPDTKEATRLSGSHSKRNSSSSNSSSNGSSDNLYQIPRSMDPIYQIPTSTPIQIQAKTEEFPAKIQVRKLHSVGHNISKSPRLSVDSPNYSNMVTDYLCSSPNLNTPPTSPIPSHKPVPRNHLRSVTMPRCSTYNNSDLNEEVSWKLSSCSNHSANYRDTNYTTTDPEVSDRILSQIRELEDQLINLTSSSPCRGSLSPHLTLASATLPQGVCTEAQRLIDKMRNVVYEAITFHKQASQELQLAKTEKKLAERARHDADLNTLNIQTLLSSIQHHS